MNTSASQSKNPHGLLDTDHPDTVRLSVADARTIGEAAMQRIGYPDASGKNAGGEGGGFTAGSHVMPTMYARERDVLGAQPQQVAPFGALPMSIQ